MVESSYECRWFFAGRVPEVVQQRFWDVPLPDGQPEPRPWPEAWRVDSYLPMSADMGVKTRHESQGQPRLEFKGLLSDHGPVAFGSEATGNCERWVKWSYRGESLPADLLRTVNRGDASLEVRKKRLLREITLRPGGGSEAGSAENQPGTRGVQIELTWITLPQRDGDDHWTLSFEASPMDPNLPADVHRSLADFLQDMGTVCTLAPDNSLSYPAWLERLTDDRP